MTVEMIADNITAGELLTELNKPGDVYVAALISEDVIEVRAVKSDLKAICRDRIKSGGEGTEMGWSAWRHDNGVLSLDSAH